MAGPSPAPIDFGRGGALLIDKDAGITSFGVIEQLQKRLREATGLKRRELPALGHGGTLDPFATGLLVVCIGDASKLARYFLGSRKGYEGVIRFGETTISGDFTDPVTERTERVPSAIGELTNMAARMAMQPYLQTPPMHSAKKRDGKPLYELARQGIEVEREPKLCHLHAFEVTSYEVSQPPLGARARIRVECSAGTYIRTLAQDFARLLGSLGALESLRRTRSGSFELARAVKLDQVLALDPREWPALGAWIPFDGMLEGFARAQASPEEARWLEQGRQQVLGGILNRVEGGAGSTGRDANEIAIYEGQRLVAVASREHHVWRLDRVFPR